MCARNRTLTMLTTGGYLLAVTASGLFHHHHGNAEEHSPFGLSARCSGDDHDCAVCRFLAQKPGLAAEVAPIELITPVEDVAAPVPLAAVCDVFTAWHSRAPPALV